MKKKTLFALGMLLSLHAFSQDRNEAPLMKAISFGSGANSSRFSDLKSENTIGFNMGVTYQQKWLSWVGYRTGVHFEQKGGIQISDHINQTGDTGGAFDDGGGSKNIPFGSFTERQTTLSYLTLPLALELSFQIRKIGFNAFAGGYAGLLLKQKFGFRESNTDNEFDSYVNNQVMNPLDAGVTFGSGTSFAFTDRLSSRVDVSYNYGLVPIGKITKGAYLNQSLNVQASFVFAFGRKRRVK